MLTLLCQILTIKYNYFLIKKIGDTSIIGTIKRDIVVHAYGEVGTISM